MKKSLIPIYPPHEPVGESKTVPNQAFTVQDILTKFAGGAMLHELERVDELGDVDEDIDTPFDAPRSGDMGDFDRHAAMQYVGTVEDEIKKARHSLDNDVLDDTKKNNSEKSEKKLVDSDNN